MFQWMQIVFEYHAKYNKRSGDKQFWTHENHAVQLDTNEMIDSKLNYIHKIRYALDGLKKPNITCTVAHETMRV